LGAFSGVAAVINPKVILFALLALFAVGFAIVWAGELTRRKQWQWPTWYESVVGFFTEFFDALGIGSFATTTALYRLRRAVPDEKIPGTLNVGHCLPTFVQAIAFAKAIEVEPATLVLLIGSSVLGAWLGAGVVARMSRSAIQRGMGVALLVAAVLLTLKATKNLPAGGEALGLSGVKLAVGIAATFAFGALMTIGIGAYAPIMIMVALMGMNPTAAWPIMTGACAFLMPVCGVRFIRAGAYAPRAALGLTILGIPGVLAAVYIFEKLPIDVVYWLVVAVVSYTAITLLIAAGRSGRTGADEGGDTTATCPR
jgi:uncharacterized membrane protein YfcA